MKTFAAAFALQFALTGFALAEGAKPVILTVTSAIDGSQTTFDRDQLQALAARSASMETPWTEGKVTFEGPLLKAVLDAAGVHGKTLVVKALNDYSAEVPAADASEFSTMLAMSIDGKAMSVRDKGPLFLIYPFDTHPELYNEKYFSRSVWQIREIEVKD